MSLSLQCGADSIGPARVLVVREPRIGLSGYVVVDNVAAGPAIGGIRMAKDVTLDEVARLARAMTWKNAAAGLPHGGGKAGIVGEPHVAVEQKEVLVRAFARAIRFLEEYIPGPDMGTDETAMAWIADEIGRVVGLPRVIGGIPLDEIGATGLGVAAACEVAAPRVGIDLDGARVVIQGFGAVGTHAARFLRERGARTVAVSDSRGGLYNADGLPIDALIDHKHKGLPVSSFDGGAPIDGDDLVSLPCDIFIPAARPDVLHARNIGSLQARLVVSGANIPATHEAEIWMHEHDVLSIPDFIANAGGVICASVEYHGGSEATARQVIVERVQTNTAEVLDRVARDGVPPREAAEAMARARVHEAMGYRRP